MGLFGFGKSPENAADPREVLKGHTGLIEAIKTNDSVAGVFERAAIECTQNGVSIEEAVERLQESLGEAFIVDKEAIDYCLSGKISALPRSVTESKIATEAESVSEVNEDSDEEIIARINQQLGEEPEKSSVPRTYVVAADENKHPVKKGKVLDDFLEDGHNPHRLKKVEASDRQEEERPDIAA